MHILLKISLHNLVINISRELWIPVNNEECLEAYNNNNSKNRFD